MAKCAHEDPNSTDCWWCGMPYASRLSMENAECMAARPRTARANKLTRNTSRKGWCMGEKYTTAHPEAERLERKIHRSLKHPQTPELRDAIQRNWDKIRQHKPHMGLSPAAPTAQGRPLVPLGLYL